MLCSIEAHGSAQVSGTRLVGGTQPGGSRDLHPLQPPQQGSPVTGNISTVFTRRTLRAIPAHEM